MREGRPRHKTTPLKPPEKYGAYIIRFLRISPPATSDRIRLCLLINEATIPLFDTTPCNAWKVIVGTQGVVASDSLRRAAA
jgi:hypothetical protein